MSAEPAGDVRERLKALFHEALDLAPGELELRLAALRSEAPFLHEPLQRLLAAHAASSETIVAAIERERRDLDRRSHWIGRRIGPWRIERELGAGGMGRVLLAERIDGTFAQKVAIKLIAAGGMASPDWSRRFDAERRALAELAHPAIARLIDAGSTPEGVPWFAMEYVEGEPIDSHCARTGADIETRIHLFLDVCAAVQHAHQHLLVHRDLKPGNIFVTAEGRIKLLDFGVAKLVVPENVADSETRTNAWLGTPEYTAPEQIGGGAITTATDVYQLGVLLYRLLAGRAPVSLAGCALAEAARRVHEEVPPRASSVASGESARRLQGDLDRVLAKALAKEPALRYASVAEFADDIERHLGGLPVRARPATWHYRAGKFARRHHYGIAALAVAVLALVVGFAAALWQAHVADQQRREAEARLSEVRRLANLLLVDVHSALARLPGTTALRSRLTAEAMDYLDDLAPEARARPELALEFAGAYRTLGDDQGRQGYANLGRSSEALASYARASALLDGALAQRPGDADLAEESARTELGMGAVLYWTGDLDGAAAHYRRALSQAETLATRHENDAALELLVLAARRGLADIDSWNGRLDAAVAAYREIIADLQRRSDRDTGPEGYALFLGETEARLGNALGWQDRGDEARAILARAVERLQALAKADPQDAGIGHALLVAELQLGENLADVSVSDAKTMYRRALDEASGRLARDPADAQALSDVALAINKLGDAAQAEHRLDEAAAHYREALAQQLRLLELAPSSAGVLSAVANSHWRIAHAERGLRHAEAADTAMGEALNIRLGIADAAPDDLGARRDVAVTYQAQASWAMEDGDNERARSLYSKAVSQWQALDDAGGLKDHDRVEYDTAKRQLALASAR